MILRLIKALIDLLIVGSSSTIGNALSLACIDNKISVLSTTRRLDPSHKNTIHLDLSHPSTTWQLSELEPKAAVICAGITSQRACEDHFNETYAINVKATIELASRLVSVGAFVVFLSSNLVFDGDLPMVSPSDSVCPKTAYGRQKAEVEQYLLGLFPDSISVIRFGKIMHRHYPLICDWVSNLRSNSPISPFYDMYVAPLYIDGPLNLIQKVLECRRPGIIHFSATYDVSYAQIAFYVAMKLGLNLELIRPVSSTFSSIGHNPRYTSLRDDNLKSLGILACDPWIAIDQLLNELS